MKNLATHASPLPAPDPSQRVLVVHDVCAGAAG
jgi:hypothetical protein